MRRLSAAALVEEFLARGTVGTYQPGARYFFRHRHGEDLFVCFENKVVQHVGCLRQVVLRVPPEEFFLAVNTLKAEGRPLLGVLASSQDYTASTLRFFELVS